MIFGYQVRSTNQAISPPILSTTLVRSPSRFGLRRSRILTSTRCTVLSRGLTGPTRLAFRVLQALKVIVEPRDRRERQARKGTEEPLVLQVLQVWASPARPAQEELLVQVDQQALQEAHQDPLDQPARQELLARQDPSVRQVQARPAQLARQALRVHQEAQLVLPALQEQQVQLVRPDPLESVLSALLVRPDPPEHLVVLVVQLARLGPQAHLVLLASMVPRELPEQASPEPLDLQVLLVSWAPPARQVLA